MRRDVPVRPGVVAAALETVRGRAKDRRDQAARGVAADEGLGRALAEAFEAGAAWDEAAGAAGLSRGQAQRLALPWRTTLEQGRMLGSRRVNPVRR